LSENFTGICLETQQVFGAEALSEEQMDELRTVRLSILEKNILHR
jgi:hypothetical protein